MSEILPTSRENAYEARRAQRIAATIRELDLRVFRFIDEDLPPDHPEKVGMIVLTQSELDELASRVRARLKIDEFVLQSLAKYGVPTILNDLEAIDEYEQSVCAAHCRHHPKYRSSSNELDSIRLAMGAHFQTQRSNLAS